MRFADGDLVLEVARASIREGLRLRRRLHVNPAGYPPILRELRATFVTLRIEERLRGCTGALEARRPLVCDVADHAYSSAFEDPRFSPLASDELEGLSIDVSILSDPEPFGAASDEELVAQLRPEVDGLILRLGDRKATFLPSVWESVPDPQEFLRELKRKAGLPLSGWPEGLQALRYRVESAREPGARERARLPR